MAIGGQGFFSVALAKGTTNGQPVFDERQFFTRAGDVALDKDGYLVNGAGYYLQGWPADAAGNPDRTILNPIRVNQQVFKALKPGGVYLIVDHAAAAGAPVADTANKLHRIDVAVVKKEVEAAGFKLAAEDKMLANPASGSAHAAKFDHVVGIADYRNGTTPDVAGFTSLSMWRILPLGSM